MNELVLEEKKQYNFKVFKYRENISRLYYDGVNKFLEIGKKLIEADDALSSDEYEDLVNNLPFSPSSAKRYVLLAEKFSLLDPVFLEYLPESLRAQYAISQLEVADIEELIMTGEVHVKLSTPNAEALKREYKDTTSSVERAKNSRAQTLVTIELIQPDCSKELAEDIEKTVNELVNKHSDEIRSKFRHIVSNITLTDLASNAKKEIEDYKQSLSDIDKKLICAIENAIYDLSKSKQKQADVENTRKPQQILLESHSDYLFLSNRLNDEQLTIDKLKSYCKKHKIHTKYTPVKYHSESVHLSEQIVLFTSGKRKSAIKNLQKLASETKDDAIKNRATTVLEKLSCYV